MNDFNMNFSTPEIYMNSTANSVQLTDILTLSIFSINVLFVFPTQSYIIWLIVTGTGSGVAAEFFNLNLSVCEIGNCLNCLFFIISISVSGMRVLTQFLMGLVFTGRPLFQSLMCVERYLAVVHPVTFLKYKPLRYRVICCSVAWIIIIVSCLFCKLILSSMNEFAYTWFFSLPFLLFLSIQLFCLLAVLRALKQSGPGERKREREEENNMKRRAFFLILITTVSMVVIYVPYIVTGLFTIFTQQIIQTLWLASLVCFVLGSFVHPVLYLQRTRRRFH